MSSPQTSPGPGAVLLDGGAHFRVWAPHARRVFVTGAFNRWEKGPGELTSEGNGFWSGHLDGAAKGHEYRLLLETEHGDIYRNDPYARLVTHSVGNSVVYDPDDFDWGPDPGFQMAPWNQLVIYEMHVGTFHVVEAGRPGTFHTALEKLPYLVALGINAIEVMPAAEFPGEFSWGYNPAHPFAIETGYGGPDAFKTFVKTCHEHGVAVIMDVVYNHFGPSDLDLWQFDGWSENGLGGIYFYNDWRAKTPWGDTRPDYGRPEVRQYILDNALMWIEEYRVDGLRMDMTPYIRTVHGSTDDPGSRLDDGASLLHWMNGEIQKRHPGKLLIAEDMKGEAFVTTPVSAGGLGFNAQWDSLFVHPVREALIAADDAHRDLNKVTGALSHRYGPDAFTRVVFTESHDEVSNGRARVAEDIAPGNVESWYALKRSTLGGALVLTAPGIPMLFQGQALYEDGWFSDSDPLDWSRVHTFRGINQLYMDLIALRRNRKGLTPGLTGHELEILAVDHQARLLAYGRWQGDKADSTVVVMNFSAAVIHDYHVPFPVEGAWYVHFNSDWDGYHEEFSNHFSYDPLASTRHDGIVTAPITIAPYTALILSRVAPN